MDYLLSVVFVFSTDAQKGWLHIGLHTVGLLCDSSSFAVTVLLQKHRKSAERGSSRKEDLASIFLIMSGSLSFATFVANMMGIRRFCAC
jgi:hypothetical protein